MDTEALKKSLMKKFQEVTSDRLQKIQLGVIELEKPTAAQAAEEVARELHTMKGEARMLGLAAIGQIAHGAEDVLKAEREGRAPTVQAADLLLRACDALSDLVEDLEGAQRGTEGSEEICRLLAQTAASSVPSPAASVSSPVPKATAAAAASTAFVLQPSPPGKVDEEGTVKANADRSIRVNVEVLDSLGLLAGDLLVESARAKLRGDEMSEILERFARMGDKFLRLSEGVRERLDDRSLFDRLEGDLHILRDDAFRFVRRHGDGMNTLHGNLSKLADHVSEARLVPLASVFESFPRAVREMSKSQGKEVDLEIDNPGVGVDRSMLADVRDALVHLLRNAVDHGVETPAARGMLGKSASGKLFIRARADGDMLQMEVADDGGGIDPERLRAAAVAKKILEPSQAAALSEREAIELIFKAGFSTRDQVSELSGRGVGMDVVKRKVEALGGSVSVKSQLGRGTTISLRLPQSLALMRVLLVRLGDDVYGMPAADVEAVVRVRPEDRMEVSGTLAINHREQPIALVALGPLLGINGGNRFERPPAVVVHHGQDRAALVVDGFVDEREVAIKPCGGDFLNGAQFLAGTAALEDGKIAVLLHIPDIMREVRRIAQPVITAAAAKRLRVLLVDDSPIARATEAALVKALGHSLEEAQDGEEALGKLRSNAYDLVLTDVQMPKLDGIGLTRRIKGDSSLSRLPVIILSSLASPEDKRRGVDAGADAYLIKGELGVENLAQAIDRLT